MKIGQLIGGIFRLPGALLGGSLPTIVRSELLMQLKSMRFKAICLLALAVNFPMYHEGMRQLEWQPTKHFHDFEFLQFVLAVVVVSGLYSIGRIRTTGMQPILMVRPFHTFWLMLGQMLACLLSLMIPLALISFPAGPALRWQFGIEFPLRPVFALIALHYVPAACCVLAITIWVRTMIKNTFAALIVLGIIFALLTHVANSGLLSSGGEQEGRNYHNFVPILSHFAQGYWKGTFAHWAHPLFSIGYSFLFLQLGCYHLRRTEPQRKVLGNYGRRWYHVPTFARAFFDLKIDPHIGLKSHLLVLLMIVGIVGKTAWPLARPFYRNWRAKGELAAAGAGETKYEAKYFSDEDLLVPRILREQTTINSGEMRTELTFRLEADTKVEGKQLIAAPYVYGYELRTMAVDGRELAFVTMAGTRRAFVAGEQLAPFADGREHVLRIEGASLTKSGGSALFVTPYGFCYFAPRGYRFFDQIQSIPDTDIKYFGLPPREQLYPVQLEISLNEPLELLQAPVEPTIEQAKGQTTLVFNIPPERSAGGGIYLGRKGALATVPLKGKGVNVRYVVPATYERIARELAECLLPALEEFCALHNVSTEEPIVILEQNPDRLLKPIMLRQRLYANPRAWQSYHAERMADELSQFEQQFLKDVLRADLLGKGPNGAGQVMDLFPFLERNLTNGLNQDITLSLVYSSRELIPLSRKLDAKTARKIRGLSRAELRERGKPVIPVFQMLYLILGHDDWMRMVDVLKEPLRREYFTDEMLEEAVAAVSDQPLDWFFDYWLRTGQGFPCYNVESARAEMVTVGEDERLEYRVEARIANLGTGRMLVPVLLQTVERSQDHKERIWIRSGETVTWDVQTRHRPTTVVVDSWGAIMTAPCWDESGRQRTGVTEKKVEIEESKAAVEEL
ncbi:hypothetical protein ACFL34_00375 [Candidatus Sumerlaeota bacterium]